MSTTSSTVPVGGKSEITRLIQAAAQCGEADFYKGKRDASRVANALMLEATLDPDDPADVCGVTMHDIAEGGVAFWSKRKFPIRTPAYVREYTSGKPGIWLAGEITHCTVGIRGYLVGVAFAPTPDPDAEPKTKVMRNPGPATPVWRRPIG